MRSLLLILAGCVPAASLPYDSGAPCVPADEDCDGFTPARGDCDDQDPSVNPDGRDDCGDGVDEDCIDGPQQCGLTAELSLADADASWGGLTSRTGYRVAAGGDLTGDGIPEVLSSAQRGGVVEVLQVVEGQLTNVAELESEDGSGYEVALPGDVTGDGQDDLLMLPAPTMLSAETVMWVVAGPISGSRFVPAGDVRLAAPSTSGAGIAVAGPDLDGDGIAELLIGAPGLLPRDGGSVYLLEGPVYQDVELEMESQRTFAGASGQGLGTSLASAGDVDGDGLDDVLIGGGGGAEGSVVFGLNAALEGQGLDNGWRWDLDVSGYAPGLAGGDLDGDGYDELVVGEPGGSDGDGRVRVLAVGPDEPQVIGWMAGPLRGGAAAGASVQVVEDVDGDGHADLLIGGPGAEEGNGQVWLMTEEPRGAWSLADEQIAHWNGGSGYGLGEGLVAAPDLDGDGYGDVVVNSREEQRLWLFFGP